MPDPTPTPLEDAQATLANLYRIKRQITSSPKPTYNIDGQQIQWGEYLAQVDEAITKAQAQINDLDPYEFYTRGWT